MSDDEKILPHNYDGIQELNNPLPGWWLFTFYITIVFAAGYYYYYEISDGPSSRQELEASLAEIRELQPKDEFDNSQPGDWDYAALLANTEMMAKGKAQFESKCAACHGQAGEGLIGPNLADNYWIHSKGELQGIMVAIREGFLQKGMPAWKDLIPYDEQVHLAAYVKSLQGTNPQGGKGPEGTEVK